MTTSTPATGVLSTSQPEPGRKASTRVMRTRDQWKTLLEEFADSRLTRSAFCKTHQIANSSLYRWQQILADQPSGDADFIDVTPSLASTSATVPARTSNNQWQVELELDAGIVLRLRTN